MNKWLKPGILWAGRTFNARFRYNKYCVILSRKPEEGTFTSREPALLPYKPWIYSDYELYFMHSKKSMKKFIENRYFDKDVYVSNVVGVPLDSRVYFKDDLVYTQEFEIANPRPFRLNDFFKKRDLRHLKHRDDLRALYDK